MHAFWTGMDGLLENHGDWLDTGRFGLVCHPASINAFSAHSAILLRERIGDRLTCLLGPEHGFFGVGAAGEKIGHQVHPDWNIPIYSLYGDAEHALTEMAKCVDAIIFDLQDLAVRCYTYVHTLRQVMEACAKHDLRLIVTDRPAPHAFCVDGPLCEPALQSIVAPIAAPFIYGMTPAETARWLKETLSLNIHLNVVPIRGYHPKLAPAICWPDWVPPSPAIRSWANAMCYPATVFVEAIKHLDCARATGMAFRVLRAPWLKAEALVDALQARDLPGVLFAPYHDVDAPDQPALQLCVTDPSTYRPAATSVYLLHDLQQLHGVDHIWRHTQTDTRWFDRLWGTARVREQLCSRTAPEEIIAGWLPDLAAFEVSRRAARLYTISPMSR